MASITVPAQSLPNPGDALDPRPIRDYINNIVSFLESTNIDEANVDLASTDGLVGKSTTQTISGAKSFVSTSGQHAIRIGEAGDNDGAGMRLLGSSTTHNYVLGNQINQSGACELIASTATGGTTFTTGTIMSWIGATTRVGISTSSPQQALHIETGTVNIQGGVSTLSNYGLGIEGDASAETGMCVHNNSSPIGSFSVYNVAGAGTAIIRTTGSSTAVPGFAVDSKSNVIVGNAVSPAALATSATDGFLYVPTMAGTPTGNSTDYTGILPIVYDTSANRLWINVSGTTWRFVAFT